jgi:organic radical activating enzyme
VTKFDFGTIFPRKTERTAEEWIAALEKLPPAMIYIAGGEPMLYAPLPDLINHLPSKHRILGVVSNVSLPARVFRKIEKAIHINASFHREFVTEDDFIRRVKELQEFFHVVVNIVATPENLPVIGRVDQLMRHHNISLHVDPFVDAEFSYSPEQIRVLNKYTQADRGSLVSFDDFSVKRCSAGRNYINLMPGGEVFTCAGGWTYTHSPLFKDVVNGSTVDHYSMGNLFDPAFRLNSEDITCSLPCKDACDRDSVIIKTIAPAH